MKRVILFSILIMSLTSLGARGEGEQKDGSAFKIYVSILPQAYLLGRIAGDFVDIEVMVPPGKNPATYEPTPQQVVGLGSAGIFFTMGLPFEKGFLHSIGKTMPSLPLIDASEGIERRRLNTHHHGDEEITGEGAEDPHLWLSPIHGQTLARNMAEALITRDPSHKEVYEENLKELISDLTDLDKELTLLLKPVKGEILFVYHPSFGYFTDRYELKQEAIELGGKDPSPADLERIVQDAREEGVKVILVQPEFSQSSAQAVAKAINGSVIPVETLSGDYINNLRNLALLIKKGLE